MLPGPTMAAVSFPVIVISYSSNSTLSGVEPADGCHDSISRGKGHEGAQGPRQDQVARAQRVAEAAGLDGQPAQRLQRIAQAGGAGARWTGPRR